MHWWFADGHMSVLWAFSVLGLLLVGLALWVRGGSPTRSALEILEARYARGEIDDAEFERRRSGLAGGEGR